MNDINFKNDMIKLAKKVQKLSEKINGVYITATHIDESDYTTVTWTNDVTDGYYTVSSKNELEHEPKPWYVNFEHSDDWDLCEEFDTKESAIQYGRETMQEDYELPQDDQGYDCHESFEIGQVKYFNPSRHTFDIDDIIENITTQSYDVADEHCDNYNNKIYKLSAEDKQDLSQRLTDTLNEWLEEKGIIAGFGEIVNQETIETGLVDKEVD